MPTEAEPIAEIESDDNVLSALLARAASDPTATALLLCLGGERSGKHCNRPGHECSSACHWITSSARASTDGGIVRPRALAVLRLITISNFVGCSTGRSPGLAPLSILST